MLIERMRMRSSAAPAVKRETEEDGAKAMNESDRFAQADRQDRIARQREAVKQAKLRGHAVALAEAAQQALEQTLRAFEKHRQQVFERLEAKQR
jgi:PBP1b-binding outer membrane lipoprotein LpoB